MIDSHVHFWQLDRGDYTWISVARPKLNRDYGIRDFEDVTRNTDVTGCIAVQAAPTQSDTSYLLDLAEKNSAILAVTGWTDLTATTVSHDLKDLSTHPKLRAIRPMAGVRNGAEWLNIATYQSGFAALDECGLVLEALALPHHLPAIASVARAHPNLRIVVNHAAKPASDDLQAWGNDIKVFAVLENTVCKLSGFTQQSTDSAHHHHVFETLLDVFGPDRLAWGSDFPVLQETSNYHGWLDATATLLARLPDRDIAKITHQTTHKTYL
ncbi:MAG: L-fuconolactonase [Gammaproteobacteria bacterium]|jgi:L-fuconolactonase